MPLVVINRNQKKLDNVHLKSLTSMLPNMVANVLTCADDDGLLKSSDVEVRVQDFGTHDVNTKDLEIIIWANLYPEREAKLKKSRCCITNAVKEIIPEDLSGFVWILLQPGSFGKF